MEIVENYDDTVPQTKEEEKNHKLWKLMSTYLDTDKHSIQRCIVNHVEYTLACNRCNMTTHKAMLATTLSIRDRLIEDMNDTQTYMLETKAKCVNYLSIEFLLGRLLQSVLINIELEDSYREALQEMGYILEDLYDDDKDAALGNGGLGRLAACFMDSFSTMNINAWGYGIRYDYGMFEQRIEDGWQVEYPDFWLSYGNPWEIERKDVKYVIRFGGQCVIREENGVRKYDMVNEETFLAVAYDTPIPGYKTHNCNVLRLWKAIPRDEINLESFNQGDYTTALESMRQAETITSVLYPDDRQLKGKELRLRQEYFFVSATVQDILSRFLALHLPWSELPEKMAIQLNDTHPVLAIPEMMRLLTAVYEIPYNEAWSLVTRCFAYTNHTVMSEALETWPLNMMQTLLPCITQIIFDINWNFMDQLQTQFKTDPRLLEIMERTSIFSKDEEKRIRMANLAIIGSHTVNGVSQLHTNILQSQVFSMFHMLDPQKLKNITNGITPRRWLLQCNPYLSKVITDALQTDSWVTQLDLLAQLRSLASDPSLQSSWEDARLQAKRRLSAYIKKTQGIEIPEHFLFDVMTKRIHEYKRQLMNILYCIYRYCWIKGLSEEERVLVVPRVTIFGGKAAPSYHHAKNVIKLIHNVSSIVNADPDVNDYFKVVFIPDYGVSKAELIIPAADITQHISTAGTEASGTSNMKSALNGGLLLGTYDGATIEIANAIGEENVFIFGHREADIQKMRQELMNAGPEQRDSPVSNELALVLGQLMMKCFGCASLMREVIELICFGHDWYGVTFDFDQYVRIQREVDRVWKDRKEWLRRSILSTAGMGCFSSDNTIMNYCKDVWSMEPCHRPNYVQEKSSRQRSRTYPHLSYTSQSDDYVGMGI